MDVPSSRSQRPLLRLRAGPTLLRGVQHSHRGQVSGVPGGVCGGWAAAARGGEVCGGGVELRRHDRVPDGEAVSGFGGVDGGDRVGGGLDGVAQQPEPEETGVPAVVGVSDADHPGRSEADVRSWDLLATCMDSKLLPAALSRGLHR